MMSNAQATGWLLPQIPIPRSTNQVIDINKRLTPMNASRTIKIHWIGGRGDNTTLPMISVIVV